MCYFVVVVEDRTITYSCQFLFHFVYGGEISHFELYQLFLQWFDKAFDTRRASDNNFYCLNMMIKV